LVAGGKEGGSVQYSEKFKSRMVARLVGPDAVSATRLAQEVGVHQSTLSRWLRQCAGSVAPMSKKKRRPQDWSSEEKLAALAEASSLSEEDLGIWLRRKGLKESHLRAWRQASLEALESPRPRRRGKSPEAQRIRTLEKELDRKEKALAEAAALLVLKKKVEAIWGDAEDDTTPRRGQ